MSDRLVRHDLADPYGAAQAALRPEIPVWGNLGWACLAVLGDLLVVPAPWTYPAYLRFLCRHIMLPDGRRFTFAGRAGDIWWVFILLAIFGWLSDGATKLHADYITVDGIGVVVFFASCLLNFRILRWLCDKLGVQESSAKFIFTGSIWALIGLYIVFLISFVTVIGWAWVLKAGYRWACGHVTGDLAFTFEGGGWQILWRSLVLVILCVLIIPIPWMFRWYLSWMISQIHVSDAAWHRRQG